MPEELSIEEMCRIVLQAAVDDGIVTFNRDQFRHTEKPAYLTAGDLCSVANQLNNAIAAAMERPKAGRRELRWGEDRVKSA